jgi:hypothetical protein
VSIETDRVLVCTRAVATGAACPECRWLSTRVHSRYHRWLLDLPSHGRCVRLSVAVRRFRCGNPAYPRRIFEEPLAADVAPRAARRTSRLERIVHNLGCGSACNFGSDSISVQWGGRCHAGTVRRARRRSRPARPYICRFTSLSLVIWPSV